MRRPRPKPVDLLLPALLGIVGTVEILTAGYQPRLLACGTLLLAAGVLAFARPAPLATPLLVAVIYATTPLFGFDVSQPATWVPIIAAAAFGAGLHAPRPRRLAGLACVLVALGIAAAGLAWFTEFRPNMLFGLILTVVPWALGDGLRRTLDQHRDAAARAERERVDVALAGRRAAKAARERIAVELPDVLAHALGAMLVQSSAAGDLLRRDPEATARALHAVADSGREALAETARLLRLLRDDGDHLRLPSGGGARPASAERFRRRDLVLPAVIGVIGTIEIGLTGGPQLWRSLAAYWLATGLLCARRVRPLGMPVGVTAIAVTAPLAHADTDDPASWIMVIAVAYFAAGRHIPRSRIGLGLAAVLASAALFVLAAAARDDLSADVVFVFPFAIGPWAVGCLLRWTLERTSLLAAEAERARLERDLAAERAVGAERRQIARELHDVLAKSLNVMVIQAALAADLVVANPDAAAEAIAEVERSGRAALGDTGRLLRLIDKSAPHPQRGLTDLPALAAEYTHAGLTITMVIDPAGTGAAERLPAGVNVSIYHVVQEALTNVLKHAPGSPVRVRLARRPSEVAVEVRNGPAAGPVRTVPSGHGLTGLRERVSVFGGSLDARPTADGGFVLSATMPVAEAP